MKEFERNAYINLKGRISKLNTDLDEKSAVSFTQTLTSGEEIGTITIDGTGTKIYAPEVETNVIYSTNEQEIGKWIDGKTLYQKTIIGSSHTGSETISISDLSADVVFIKDGFIAIEGAYLGLNQYISSSYFTYTHIGTDGKIYNNITGYTGVMTVTILYTKAD